MFGDPLTNNKNFTTNKMITVVDFKMSKEIAKKECYWTLNLDMIESNTGKIIEKIYLPKEKIGPSTYYFTKDFVLYSKLRPYLNKVAIPDEDGFATTELVPMKPTKIINKVYLAFLLRNESFVTWINASSYGAKMTRASVDNLKNFDFINNSH